MEKEVYVDFLDCLDDLSVNSRPVIKTLTEIAEENVKYSGAVANAISDHIMRTPPAKKLPAFYLLDSITKNHGQPYTDLFAPRLYELFTETFNSNPEPIKVKLSDLFKTWTATGHHGTPVFPHTVLRGLNDFMMQQSGKPSIAPAMPRQRLTQSALMVEINRLRQSFDQEEGSDFVEKQLSLLDRLETTISGVVDPKELPAVQEELEQIKYNRDNRRPRGSVKRNRNQLNGNTNHNKRAASNEYPDAANESAADFDYSHDGQTPAPPRSQLSAPLISTDTSSTSDGSQQGTPQPATPNAANLPGTLKQDTAMSQNMPNMPLPNMPMPMAGVNMPNIPSMPGLPNMPPVMSMPGIPGIPGMPNMPNMPGMPMPFQMMPDVMNTVHPGSVEPIVDKDALISELSFSTAAESDVNPALVELFYSDLPIQCPTCGFRFPNTEEGKKMEVAEMDWHFRCNKDIRENHSRNRLYYLTLEQWIIYKDEDEIYGSQDSENNEASKPEEKIDFEALKKQFVECDSDEDQICPVCQEVHTSAWSEEAENWVWMNCVEKNGYYFHATCFADPANADLVASICK